MHIGWSTWCAIVVVVLASRWWVKLLGIAYPLVTLVVIAGTANHYFLDAVGGLIALGIGFAAARVITGSWPFQETEDADPQPSGSSPNSVQVVDPR
jgi:hypothetical protein